MKAVVAAFNQEKALVGAFSVITNLRMELFEALVKSHLCVQVAGTSGMWRWRQRTCGGWTMRPSPRRRQPSWTASASGGCSGQEIELASGMVTRLGLGLWIEKVTVLIIWKANRSLIELQR